MITSHVFYSPTVLLDVRYLIVTETVDALEDEDAPYGIGCLLDVGHTPQRAYVTYLTRDQRDTAFARLCELHHTWMAQAHACDEEEDDA